MAGEREVVRALSNFDIADDHNWLQSSQHIPSF